MNAITVWFSNLTKSGKLTVVLVYVMVFMTASAVIAVEYQQDQLANAPVDTVASSPYEQETLSAVTEQKRILMVFEEVVPFKTKKVEDPTLAKGQSYVQSAGENGIRDVTYEVTYQNGEEVGRVVLKEKILKKPVAEVKIVGTYEAEPIVEPASQTLGVKNNKRNQQVESANEDVTYTRIYVWKDRKYACVPSTVKDIEAEYGKYWDMGTFDEDSCSEESDSEL